MQTKLYSIDSEHNNRRNGIKTITLKQDISRGVKHLSEWSYAENWGSTRGSLRFINELRKHIDLSAVHTAKLTYSQGKQFTLWLYTREGFTVHLKGVSGGFFGEGTRGCHDVLKVCGFTQAQCDKAFKHESFTVKKSLKRV